MKDARVRPIRPSRDQTHIDRKKEIAKNGTAWDDLVEDMLFDFEKDGYEVKYPKPRKVTPEVVNDFAAKHWPNPTPGLTGVRCPDCGGLGTGHRDFCIHRDKR